MSFVNKLDPSSAAFVPDPNNQPDTFSNYMNLFGTDFSAGFPDLTMEMTDDPSAPEQHPQNENSAGQRKLHSPTAFSTPGITLERVQMDMYIAFNSFMQLQSEYQAKLRCVETELAKNVQEAHNLRQDVDVLSNWAKAVLEHFGQEGAPKEAKVASQAQDPVL